MSRASFPIKNGAMCFTNIGYSTSICCAFETDIPSCPSFDRTRHRILLLVAQQFDRLNNDRIRKEIALEHRFFQNRVELRVALFQRPRQSMPRRVEKLGPGSGGKSRGNRTARQRSRRGSGDGSYS